MAIATYTCTVFDAQPKSVQSGIVSVSGTIAAGTTVWTVGDVIFLAKIPHGAKYVASEFDHTTGAAGTSAFTIQYGFSKAGAAGGAASLSALNTAGNAGGILRKTVLGIPADISCSDNDVQRFGILAASVVVNTSPTAVTAINFTYMYRVDGAGG